MDDVLDDDDEDLDEEEDGDEESEELSEDLLRHLSVGSEMVRGTGQVFPSKFVPANSNLAPLEAFPNRHRHINAVR